MNRKKAAAIRRSAVKGTPTKPAPVKQKRQRKTKAISAAARAACTDIWTPVVMAQFLAALEAGMSREGACGIACVSVHTVDKKLEAEELFSNLVREAESKAETAAVTSVMAAITGGSWKAAAFFLERRFPESWSAQGPLAKAMRADVVKLREKLEEVKVKRLTETGIKPVVIDVKAIEEGADA